MIHFICTNVKKQKRQTTKHSLRQTIYLPNLDTGVAYSSFCKEALCSRTKNSENRRTRQCQVINSWTFLIELTWQTRILSIHYFCFLCFLWSSIMRVLFCRGWEGKRGEGLCCFTWFIHDSWKPVFLRSYYSCYYSLLLLVITESLRNDRANIICIHQSL